MSKPSANKSVGLAAVALQTFSTEIVKTVVHAPSGVEILHGGIACEEPRYVEMLETVKLGRGEPSFVGMVVVEASRKEVGDVD